MSFVHLHTHSEFSLLDGANRLGDLVRRAAELEMPALALTDHGCMFGAWNFYHAARAQGIKPILGMEAYVAPGDRRDRTPPARGERPYHHLVLLARDLAGYRNLVRLSSLAYLEGFYHRPRLDRELLARHSEGLIVTSACMAGEVSRHLLADRWDAAREAAAWYADAFDGRYYLEVQAHDTSGQRELNQRVFRLADELGLPVVATNDAHFLGAQDHDAHDVLLCIGLGKDREDSNRMRYDAGLYFKAGTEIAERFPDRPDVVENTLAIADAVDLTLERKYHLPTFPLPAGFGAEAEYMEHIAREGARARYGDPLPAEAAERLDYELGVIKGTGYAGYFLIVHDFIAWARSHGIPVGPGRGSAAGSLIAYALGITDVDPLRFDLLFERFLNPERVSMPDIDIDFCYERRGEVIDYVREKYGRESVGQIITFGTMKSRAVIRDVGRVLGFEPGETDRLAKLIPNAPNYSLTVQEAARQVPELKELKESDPRVARLLQYAQVLEGLARHASVHAAGVVIAPGPLEEYVPVCTQSTRGAGADTNGGEENVLVTQWDMNALEQAGMLKMDFLGLKTLTVIHDAVDWIRRRHGGLRHPVTGQTFDRIEDVPLDDAAVYEMLAHGGTPGVFQFESPLALDKLRAMRCDRFEDLIATNALIRPGPLDSGMTDVYIRRKLGREPVAYPLPELEEVLEPTYGVITYQEQVMRIAQLLAGFSLAEADVLRKAVGKKDAELIARELERFVERAVANGIEHRTAEQIGEQILTFGRYGFNRAHSVAYALLSYQTAWLKRHYPAEFMAALLSSVADRTDDVVKYIGECRDLARHVPERPGGVRVLPPDVNESEWKFTPTADDEVRCGLGAVRGLGEGAVRVITAARDRDGPFRSVFDLVERCESRALGKRALEALVLAGACDGMGERARLLAGLEVILQEAQLRRAEAAAGQVSLFDPIGGAGAAAPRPEPKLPEARPWPETERLAREKEVLGFFLSGHPLEKYRDEVRLFDAVNTANLKEHRDRRIEIACVVTAVARQTSRRNGAEWGRLTIEDFHGTATALAFGEAWEACRDVLAQDAPILLRGQVSGRDRDEDDPPIFVDGAEPLHDLRASGAVALELDLSPGKPEDATVSEAGRLLRDRPGAAPVYIRWLPSAAPSDSGGEAGAGAGAMAANGGAAAARLFRSRSLEVEPAAELMDELRRLLGRDRVRLVKAVKA